MPPKSRQTVLLVEDVGWIRRSMGNVLRGFGFHVVETADASEAVAAASAEPPDVIVTDEKLPTLGELSDGVRGPGPLRGVPVVIINPDEEESTLLDNVVLLPAYDRIESLLRGARE